MKIVRDGIEIELTKSERYEAWCEYERDCTVPVLWDMIADRAPFSLCDTEVDALAESAWHIYIKNVRLGCSEDWSMEDAVKNVVVPYLDAKLKQRDYENTIS